MLKLGVGAMFLIAVNVSAAQIGPTVGPAFTPPWLEGGQVHFNVHSPVPCQLLATKDFVNWEVIMSWANGLKTGERISLRPEGNWRFFNLRPSNSNPPVSVPEPGSTLGALAAGLIGLGLFKARGSRST